MLGRETALEIVHRALDMTRADQVEVTLRGGDQALTRYAGSVIHQNVTERDTVLSIRAVIGKKVGFVESNATDDEGIRRLAERARAVAEAQEENPDFVSLPSPTPLAAVDAWRESTAGFTPEERARAVEKVVQVAGRYGASASGAFSTHTSERAVVNSLGVEAYGSSTTALLTAVMNKEPGGFGYADQVSRDAAAIDPEAVAEEAAETCARGVSPRDLAPGVYPVILKPYAVADMVMFLGWMGLGALSVQEHRSFMNDRFGQRITGEAITLYDDGLDPAGLATAFDPEGVAKQRVEMIVNGHANAVVYDSYTAHREGKQSTGHASGGAGVWGPLPRNVFLAPGDADLDAMIADTPRGILVTRFHYTNVLHPVKTVFTGMTRDGTFWIENGQVAHPVKNLRFTQSILDALDTVSAIGRETKLQAEGGACRVPALRLDAFEFSSATEF